MAMHSIFNDNNVKTVCGIPLLPIRTKANGPAPSTKDFDIIDQAYKYFRVNVLFKNFEIKCSGDKLLVYLLVYLTQCFKVTQNEKLQQGAKKRLGDIVSQKVPRPKDKGFFMSSILDEGNFNELNIYNDYLRQVKQQTAVRFLQKFYAQGMVVEDHRFWAGLSKKKFMGFNFSSLF